MPDDPNMEYNEFQSDSYDNYDDVLEEGFDAGANLKLIKENLSPAGILEAPYTEEEASDFIEAFWNAEINQVLSYDEGSYANSSEILMKSFFDKLEQRKKKIIKAKKNGKSVDNYIAEVEEVAKVLREFIRTFCRAYILFAPTVARKSRFPRSEGFYVRSSIMYFTNDEASRRNAMMKALSAQDVPSSGEEFIFGQSYILKQLTPYRLFHRDGDIEKRINRVLGGISVENFASKQKKNGSMYYYGWINVEREGWHTYGNMPIKKDKGKKYLKKKAKPKAPYSPFAHALEYANVYSKGLINYQFHDDKNMYSTWSSNTSKRFEETLENWAKGGKGFPTNVRRTRG